MTLNWDDSRSYGSKFIVTIETPWLVSYLTSTKFNIISFNSTSGLAEINIPDVHQKQYITYILGLYFGVKFGEDRRSIATCRALNWFKVVCVTDALTDTQTH